MNILWGDFRVLGGLFLVVLSVNVKCEDFHASATESQNPEYDDKDVQFENSPPNLLVLLADPKNGSTVPLASQQNSDVVLERSSGKVHLFCSAYYPVKWVYSGDGFPFLNVDNTRFAEDFYDPTTYAFSALVELEGLKESQTGKYSCQKWDNASFSSYFQIYVPGERILLAENNTKVYIDAAVSQVRIPCSVSDPHTNVTLLKSFDKGQGQKAWISISPAFYTYTPTTGFTFKGSSVPTAIGDFICQVGESQKVHVSVTVNNTLAGSNVPVKEDCCDKKFLRSLGDERTSCRAFISERCQGPEYLDADRSSCADWKISEFLKSPVELCKQEIAPSNSSVAVGYFVTTDQGGPRLYMYCQADPKEYTQGFKLAVEWSNGSMVFVDDDRLLVPGLSEFPSGYEVHAEITDLLNPESPLDPLVLHCYIPLKFSFKWIKILKPVQAHELVPIANAWYGYGQEETTEKSQPPSSTTRPRTRTTTTSSTRYRKPEGNVRLDTNLDNDNRIGPESIRQVNDNDNESSSSSVRNGAESGSCFSLTLFSSLLLAFLLTNYNCGQFLR